MDVHATPDDLRRGVAKLRTGAAHRIFFEADPEKSPSASVPAAVFAFDSSFPGPGVFLHLSRIQKLAEARPEARLVVFGHTDKKGSDAYNKGLSDRRARAILALLTNDLKMFDKLAEHEHWGTKHYQAMLRGVGCNPGAIDGEAGPLLREAVKAFQREYNDGVYHEDGKTRAHPDLAVDGVMGSGTKAAIRDAYVNGTPGDIDAGRFKGPSFAGCSDFNLVSDKDEENRRVVVAFFGSGRPADKEFPCKEGNVAACPVDGKRPRCSFYRKMVEEKPPGPFPRFFDFQWLKQKNGVAHLSALTALPDGTACTFTIHKCENEVPRPAPESSSGKPRPVPGKVLGKVDGKIFGGVAFAKWTPPSDYDPFDHAAWLTSHDARVEVFERADHEEGPPGSLQSIDGILAAKGMEPPVYVIDAGEHWGFSRPPGARLNRVRFTSEGGIRGRALRADGGWIDFEGSGGRVRAPDDVDVLAIAIVDRKLEVEPAAEEDGGAGSGGGGGATGGDTAPPAEGTA